MEYYPELKKAIKDTFKQNSFACINILHAGIFEAFEISPFNWGKVAIASKEFPLWHYDRGLYSLQLRTLYYPDIGWVVQFHVGNVDDGSWEAWSRYFPTLEQAQELVAKIVPTFKELLIMPSEDELNEMLLPFGMFGQLEG